MQPTHPKITNTLEVLNTQPAEKPTTNKEQIDVVHIWKSIQGEGPFAGCRAVFIRLAGCNLRCPSCDTNYTSNRRFLTKEEIRREVQSLQPIQKQLNQGWTHNLVVITGGEPFRQEIGDLVRELVNVGYRVQIETNGTLFIEDFPYLGSAIVCSPKTPHIHPDLVPWLYALKYVGRAGELSNEDGLPLNALGSNFPCRPPHEFIMTHRPIYLQPLDEGDPVANEKNLAACAESCMKFGYILGIQIHKYAKLD